MSVVDLKRWRTRSINCTRNRSTARAVVRITSPHPYDWDLLGLAYELRYWLYGGLSEDDISQFIHEGKRLPKMRGLMGFYCLLDDPSELKRIDGWMLSVVRRAMVKRNEFLSSHLQQNCPTPSNAELATGSWLHPEAWQGHPKPEARLPSLVRGWRAARKHYLTFGLEDVEAPDYKFYSDFGFYDVRRGYV